MFKVIASVKSGGNNMYHHNLGQRYCKECLQMLQDNNNNNVG